METFALYMLKSIVWLTGFTIIYTLFLRDERFFLIKRYYLIAGILISFIFPLITFHYRVELPSAVPDLTGPAQVSANYGKEAVPEATDPIKLPDLKHILLAVYLSGLLFFLYRLSLQLRLLFKTIKAGKANPGSSVRVVRSSEFSDSFSFFNYIFINPSVSENEMNVIMNHELVHVNQKHWLDLCLAEMLRLFQWVNPFAWIYTRLIRQNHEYMADAVALQHTPDQSVYKAVLVNQLFNSEVIRLSNSFNYSLNKKRFDMMKKIVFSPYRKMKLLLVLPVFAIVFYAFAEPEYNIVYPSDNKVALTEPDDIIREADNEMPSGNIEKKLNMAEIQKKEVRGFVAQQDGKPLQGAAIIVKGTTMGTTSDTKGHFRLLDIPEDGSLVVSFVGFKTKVIDNGLSSEMKITMVKDTVNMGDLKIVDKDNKEAHPLIVLDGIVTDKDIRDIDSWTIISINVVKEKAATDLYGEKGKNGVIEITTRKKEMQDKALLSDRKPEASSGTGDQGKDLFVVVEEMPEFPGGRVNLRLWLSQNTKYPAEAKEKKITGRVFVDFVVSSNGKVGDIKIYKPVHPLLDAEAIRVISIMPDWKPGTQSGNPVDVSVRLPVEFN